MIYIGWIIFSLLNSVDLSFGRQQVRSGHGGLRVREKDGQENRGRPSRQMWEFEQDDIFEKFVTAPPTVTDRPTTSPAPTDHPTIHPSLSPSPTVSPSLQSSSRPIALPSSSPSARPSLPLSSMPSNEPSLSSSSIPSNEPSFEPTLLPSQFPSAIPNSPPSLSSSSMPSKEHAFEPTFLPSEFTSVIPKSSPSLVPSSWPTLVSLWSPSSEHSIKPSYVPSKHPSVSPTLSLAPTLVISTTRINKFTIILTNPPNTPAINPSEVITIASAFLDDYLKENLPEYLRYRGVELYLERNNGRKLQSMSTINCIGEVRFNLFAAPDSTMVNDYVLNAFKTFKNIFFERLKGSNISNLETLLDVNTKDNRVFTEYTSTHLTVIVGAISLVVIGTGFSYVWKRSQENNAKKRLLRAAEHTLHHRGKPELDDDCFRDIEPQPIEISEDNKALERMVLRSRHDRGVMNRANELLLERLKSSRNIRRKEVQFDPILNKHESKSMKERNKVTVSEVKDDDSTKSAVTQSISQRYSLCISDHTVEVCSPCSFSSSVAGNEESNLIDVGYNDIETQQDLKSSSLLQPHNELETQQDLKSSSLLQPHNELETQQDLNPSSLLQSYLELGDDFGVEYSTCSSAATSPLHGDSISLPQLLQQSKIDNNINVTENNRRTSNQDL